MVQPRAQVRIVLVRPRNPLNIGAAARAMKNFGLDDLVLVAPHEPVWQESRSAPGAEGLLATARAVSNLAGAIVDCNLVLGASSLARRKLVPSTDSIPSARPLPSTVPLDGFSSFWELAGCPERVALVFGPEKTGLTNHDLASCHAVLRIPTAADCPSMNLGQAVAVCCYEIRRLRLVAPEPAVRGGQEASAALNRATFGEIHRLASAIEHLLDKDAVRAVAGREKVRLGRLRQLLLRWPLTSQDVTFLLGVLRDLIWRLEHDSKSRPSKAGQ